jgi:hypothetical protein
VKKYKEWCVKMDLYFILNYLYTHGDGENKKKSIVNITDCVLHNEEHHDLCCSLHVVQVIK